MSRGNETCARLSIGGLGSVIFIKALWFPSHFSLFITDGLHAWTCHATEQAVADRAAGWDENVSEYLERAKFYLSHQHPDSTYAFVPEGDNRKLSWTMEKQGTKLEGKWKCEKARNDQQINCEILNFLMDANIKLSEEVLRKTQSFDRMKVEAEKCLKQSEQFKNEKQQFEVEIFQKFVAVLNSKKAKLRELRDKIAMLEPSGTNEVRGLELDNETESEEDDEDDSRNDTEGDKPPPNSLQVNVKENTSFDDKPTQNVISAEQNPLKEQYVPVADGESVKSAAALFCRFNLH